MVRPVRRSDGGETAGLGDRDNWLPAQACHKLHLRLVVNPCQATLRRFISLHDQPGVFGVGIAENCSGCEAAPVTKTWDQLPTTCEWASAFPLIASKEGAPLRVALTNDNGPGVPGLGTLIHSIFTLVVGEATRQSGDHSAAVSFSYVHRAHVSLPFHIRELAFGPGNQTETYLDNCFAIAQCT
ncbi:hypothetical protein BDN71DRAFT_1506656 [Pleurotus eryngii]|uniref:Uncharacterized protein n=1 Tax=Pleurotus eryngii TaxID=5323 RepID=A0A9P6DG67_PLEER|nr:hypothetical protein BDN71DRAFT_1506656 [Pleurotus eryngii]